jgi:signal recognition particle subunit SRP54
MMAACDVYRPAAIQQLKVLGEQIDVPVYSEEGNNDPVSIAKNAVKSCPRFGCFGDHYRYCRPFVDR